MPPVGRSIGRVGVRGAVTVLRSGAFPGVFSGLIPSAGQGVCGGMAGCGEPGGRDVRGRCMPMCAYVRRCAPSCRKGCFCAAAGRPAVRVGDGGL